MYVNIKLHTARDSDQINNIYMHFTNSTEVYKIIVGCIKLHMLSLKKVWLF